MSGKLKRLTLGTLVIFTALNILLLAGCQPSAESVKSDKAMLTPTVPPSPAAEGKVLIVTGEYIPYVGEALESQGFLTRLIEESMKNCDFEYEIKFYPWARCREMVESGLAWASYPYGHSELYDEAYLFSNKIYSTKHKFYYLKGNEKFQQSVLDYDSIDDFEDFIFGGANGYWYGNRRDLVALGVQPQWAKNTDALLKMLYSGRIDFMIEDELVCEKAIQRLFPEDVDAFATLQAEAKLQDYYLIVSKKYPDSQKFLEQFNRALKEAVRGR